VESFIGELRDELMNREIFDTLLEARVITEAWWRNYHRHRPPAPEAKRVENFPSEAVS